MIIDYRKVLILPTMPYSEVYFDRYNNYLTFNIDQYQICPCDSRFNFVSLKYRQLKNKIS